MTGSVKIKSRSKSDRAGLTFPVGATGRRMREGPFGCMRVSVKAAVASTASAEYIGIKLAELASKLAIAACKLADSKGAAHLLPRAIRVTPHHLNLAVDSSPDLRRLMRREALIRPVGTSGTLAVKSRKARAVEAVTA